MDIAPPSGGETSLEMAVRVANQIVQQKVGLGYIYMCDTYLYSGSNAVAPVHHIKQEERV